MILRLASFVFLLAACSGGESSSPEPAPEKAEETVAADDSEPVEEEQNDTPEEEEISLISEARARDILEASCLAAGCHAGQEDTLVNNASLTRERVADGSMPPDYQARYTLSDTRRKQLIKFFESKLEQ